MGTEDRLTLTDEMFDFVRKNEIFYICDLWAYAESERKEDWYIALKNRKTNFFFKTYLKSKRETMRRKGNKVPPPANSWHNIENKASQRP